MDARDALASCISLSTRWAPCYNSRRGVRGVAENTCRGAVLSGAALGAVGAGGYLGGHLVYAQRTGVDAEVPVIESEGWHIAVRDSELLDGQPLGVDIEDGRVVLVRVDGAVYTLASVCSHAGGPLEKGTVAHASIECPWHGSRFRLGDGSVERGPATTPAFAYAARASATARSRSAARAPRPERLGPQPS